MIKPPPHNEQIEQAILGIYLGFPKTQKMLNSTLKPEMFHDTTHAYIYKYLSKYKDLKPNNDTPIDVVAFMDFLERKNGALKSCGGRDYIGGLVMDQPTAAGLESLLGTLDDLYTRRDLIAKCHAIINSCYDNFTSEVGDVLGDMKIVMESANDGNRNLAQEVRGLIESSSGVIMSSYVYSCLQVSTRKDKKNISAIMVRLEKEGIIKRTGRVGGEYRIISNVCETKDWKTAVSSSVDIVLPLGLSECVKVRPGSILCFAAKPNVGKTAMAMDFIRNNCNSHKTKYYTSETDESEFNERAAARDDLSKWNVEFIDGWISADIQDIVDTEAINVIDYLEPPGGDFTQMANKLTEIQHNLKTGIAVIFIQVRGDGDGVGGAGMKEKPQFYCKMKVKDFPVLEMEIIKCKSMNYGYKNPYRLTTEFKVNPKNGCELLPFDKFRFEKWRD